MNPSFLSFVPMGIIPLCTWDYPFTVTEVGESSNVCSLFHFYKHFSDVPVNVFLHVLTVEYDWYPWLTLAHCRWFSTGH